MIEFDPRWIFMGMIAVFIGVCAYGFVIYSLMGGSKYDNSNPYLLPKWEHKNGEKSIHPPQKIMHRFEYHPGAPLWTYYSYVLKRKYFYLSSLFGLLLGVLAFRFMIIVF